MLGRFFALDPSYSCDHPSHEFGAGMGCKKCYWKRMRKSPTKIVVTLIAPEEPENEAYPVVNGYDQIRIMPNSPWS